MRWLWLAIAIFIDGLAGMAGGLLPARWLERRLPQVVGFAAGALLAAALLDTLPEAAQAIGGAAFAWATGGFFAVVLLEWVIGHRHRGRPKGALPAMLLGADALHNVGDGAAVAAAFLLSTRAGLGLAIAVIAHEVPEEVGDYAILRAAGWPRGRALLSLAGVQLTAAIGAALVAGAARAVPPLSGAVLGIASGTFLHIGATDLLPDVYLGEGADRRARLVGLVAGVTTIAVLAALL